jgi:biopolymer transport protein ExbB
MTRKHSRTGMLFVAVFLAALFSVPIAVLGQDATPSAASPTASVPAQAIAVQPQAISASPPAVAQIPQAPAPQAPAPQTQAAANLASLIPQDLLPWGMFLHADLVVKTVILGLLFASIVTWTIWLAKTIELERAKRRLLRAYRALRNTPSLPLVPENVAARNGVIGMLVHEAREEWQRSVEALDDRDGLKERIALHFERIEALAGRHIMIGTGILATIGATAPFVGLFGTVWGIMNSFIGISKLHTTNLAVVAPGIAEALLATASGLVAAIPAVIIYNHFARQIAGYKALVADAASAVMALVSRDLSHGDHPIANAVGSRPSPAERGVGQASLRLTAE